jgi:transposase
MVKVVKKSKSELRDENKQLRQTVDDLRKTVNLLTEKVHYLLHQRFSPKSERLEHDQASLFELEAPDDVPDPAEPATLPPKQRKKGGRRRPPKHLPRERIEHDLSDEDKRCQCGACRIQIGEQVSEQYDVLPPTFRVLEHVRFVYACPKCDGAPRTAEQQPPAPLPRTQASAGILAWIGASKFVDGLPLNRIATMAERRFSVPFTTTTLADWMIKAEHRLISPLVAAMDRILRQSDYVHMDETTVQVLDEPGRRAQQKSYIWLRVTESETPVVLMHYSPSRAASVATPLLEGFSGYLQTDGYAGYNQAAARPDVTQLGCWAHARRKFDAALKSSSPAAAHVAWEGLVLIRKLYEIDNRAKNKPPDQRHQHRQQQVSPHLDRIQAWINDHSAFGLTHGGLLTTAFTYIQNQWDKLVRFLEDPRLRLDNNLAERHVRPVAMGRRAWLFCRSQDGAKASAGWYSLVETAKANGIEPYWYLRHIFEQIPLCLKEGRSVDHLLPWNLSADQIMPS